MRQKSIFSVLLCLFLMGSLAAAEVPKGSLINKAPSSVFRYEVVEFKPISKHHFELKAPISCESGEVVGAESHSIKCQFRSAGIAVVDLSVCDDDKSYCKPEQIKVEVKESTVPQAQQILSPTLLEMKEELHDQLLPDFVSGTPDEIRSRLKSEKKPVFVMISTDWCPPCNQSKEYLLSTKEFQEMTKDWLKVYVDGDSKGSRAWNLIAPFNAYPTMILLTSNLEEISRFQSEFTQKEFSDWIERIRPFYAQSYAVTANKVQKRLKGSWVQYFIDWIYGTSKDQQLKEKNQVIETAIAQLDKKVLELFSEDEIPETLKYDWYQTKKEEFLKSGMSELEFERKSLDLSDGRPSYLIHLSAVCELDKTLCQKLVRNIPARVNEIETSKDRTDAEKLGALGDEYYYQMSLYQELGDKRKAVESAKHCVQVFEKIMLASKLKVPRYGEQGILSCSKTYDLSKAEAVYKKMMAKYPSDPTFVSRYVRFLKEDKKDLKTAKVWAQRALDLSYDYNWFFAASTKVQIDKALGLSQDVRKTLQEVFARLDLDKDVNSLDQKIASRFRKLEAE